MFSSRISRISSFIVVTTYSVSYQMFIFQQDLNWPNENGHFIWNRGGSWIENRIQTNIHSCIHRVFQEQIIIVTMICLQCIFTFNFHHHHHSAYVCMYVRACVMYLRLKWQYTKWKLCRRSLDYSAHNLYKSFK